MASPSIELQTAIFERLLADAAVTALVGVRIFDRRPDARKDSPDFPCITFGSSDAVPDDYDCITARVETMQIDCWSRDGGRIRPVKEIADAVEAALHLAPLAFVTHALALIRVSGTRAMLDRDGLTGHGIVTVEALVELR